MLSFFFLFLSFTRFSLHQISSKMWTWNHLDCYFFSLTSLHLERGYFVGRRVTRRYMLHIAIFSSERGTSWSNTQRWERNASCQRMIYCEMYNCNFHPQISPGERMIRMKKQVTKRPPLQMLTLCEEWDNLTDGKCHSMHLQRKA